MADKKHQHQTDAVIVGEGEVLSVKHGGHTSETKIVKTVSKLLDDDRFKSLVSECKEHPSFKALGDLVGYEEAKFKKAKLNDEQQESAKNLLNELMQFKAKQKSDNSVEDKADKNGTEKKITAPPVYALANSAKERGNTIG